MTGEKLKRNLSSGGPSEYKLSGTGIGLSWSGPWATNIDATFSRRIGKNPNPQPSGADQDGSIKENRLWFSLSEHSSAEKMTFIIRILHVFKKFLGK